MSRILLPGRHRLVLQVAVEITAKQLQRLDAFVHPGQPLVEDQGVGNDGAGHAPGLPYVGHAQQLGYLDARGGTQLRRLFQNRRGSVDACLQLSGRLIHRALRDRHQANQISQVLG